MIPIKFYDKTPYPHIILYRAFSTPFGKCLSAFIENELCSLCFLDEDDKKNETTHLKKLFPKAKLIETPSINFDSSQFFNPPVGLQIALFGTSFQQTVWKTLTTIPFGTTISYQDIAKKIGRPQSVRAVAQAIGKNPVTFLIPCHRVIAKSGALQGYRWGIERKKRILEWEKKRN